MSGKTATEPKTVVRAVTLPVACPQSIGSGRAERDLYWRELRSLLTPAFQLTTHLANWCIRRIWSLDDPDAQDTPELVLRYSGDDDAKTCTRCQLPWGERALIPSRRRARLGCEICKCDWRLGDPSPCRCRVPVVVVRKEEIDKPPRPQCRCPGEPTLRYPRRRQWDNAIQSIGCVTRAIHKTYLRRRPDHVPDHPNRLMSEFRNPQPIRIHNQNWSLDHTPGCRVCVSLTLPLGERFAERDTNGNKPSTRVTLELLTTGPYRRQLAMLRGFLDGTVEKGEAAIHRDTKGQLLVKLVGRFPKVQRAKTPEHVCFLHTDPGAFLVAEIDGRQPWILNCDHLRRWQADHRVYLQRIAEDSKREKRRSRRQKHNMNVSRELRCDKHDRRMDTGIKDMVAQCARFWQRQGVHLVAFDDSRREYFPDGFRWHELKTRLQSKADELGIEWLDGDYLSSAVSVDRPTPPNESAGSRGVYLSFPEKERAEWLRKVQITATVTAGRRVLAHARRKSSHPAVTTRATKSPVTPKSPASAKGPASTSSAPHSPRSKRKPV